MGKIKESVDLDDLLQKAKQGDVYAQFRLGHFCYNKGNCETAVEWFRKAAEQGHRYAQYELGRCLYYGYGVDEDMLQALEWYRKAAERGHVSAQYELGKCYQYIAKDDVHAVEWYRKAAEQGHEEAQYNLITAYIRGEGVEQDYFYAAELIEKAEQQGNDIVCYMVEFCCRNGYDIYKNPEEALSWYINN